VPVSWTGCSELRCGMLCLLLCALSSCRLHTVTVSNANSSLSTGPSFLPIPLFLSLLRACCTSTRCPSAGLLSLKTAPSWSLCLLTALCCCGTLPAWPSFAASQASAGRGNMWCCLYRQSQAIAAEAACSLLILPLVWQSVAF
jgi:hypothetical protein